MTDEPRDDKGLEDEQDDVEGHGGLASPALDPALAPGLGHDDSDDDVEGHFGLSGEPGLNKPAL